MPFTQLGKTELKQAGSCSGCWGKHHKFCFGYVELETLTGIPIGCQVDMLDKQDQNYKK